MLFEQRLKYKKEKFISKPIPPVILSRNNKYITFALRKQFLEKFV